MKNSTAVILMVFSIFRIYGQNNIPKLSDIDTNIREQAQTFDRSVFEWYSATFYFGGGFEAVSFDKLNTALNAHGYPVINNSKLLGNLGFHARARGIMFGIDYGFYQGRSENGTGITEVNNSNFTPWLGYAVVNKERNLALYPGIGLTITDTRITLTDRTGIPGSMGNALTNSGYQKEFNQSIYNLNFGLNVDHYILDREVLKRNSIGIRTGYIVPLENSQYYIYDIDDNFSGPSINAGGFYISLVFGYLF